MRRCTPLVEGVTGDQPSAADPQITQDLPRVAVIAEPVLDDDRRLVPAVLVGPGNGLREQVQVPPASAEVDDDSPAAVRDAG